MRASKLDNWLLNASFSVVNVETFLSNSYIAAVAITKMAFLFSTCKSSTNLPYTNTSVSCSTYSTMSILISLRFKDTTQEDSLIDTISALKEYVS